MSCNEDDGDMKTSLRQLSLEVETAKTWEAHVENEATGYIREYGIE
jgi:hypothetical protein